MRVAATAFTRMPFESDDFAVAPTRPAPVAVQTTPAPNAPPGLWHAWTKLSGRPPASAEEAVPIRDSKAAAEERLAIIRSAQRSIIASVYCLAPDDGGVEFVEALLERARAGVQVVFCRDGIAKLANGNLGTRSADLERALLELEQAGGTVITFGSLVENLGHMGSGLHFKTLAVDSERAIVGGRNVGKMFDTWPDFDVRFKGEHAANVLLEAIPPIERALKRSGQALFLGREKRERLYAALAKMQNEANAVRKAVAEQGRASGPRYSVIVADPVALRRGFVERENPATLALIASIDAAKESLLFSSNYVRLIPQLRMALERAIARGVHVTAVTTGLSGSKLSTMSYYDAEDDYAWMRERGIEVIETSTQEHAKVFIFDKRFLIFGSYNAEHQADQSLVEGVQATDDPALIAAAEAALRETIETRRETEAQRKAVEPNPIVAFFSRILAFFLSPFL